MLSTSALHSREPGAEDCSARRPDEYYPRARTPDQSTFGL